MRGLFLLALLLPVCAFAQTPGTPALMTRDLDKSENCDAYYPAAERAAKVDGQTILAVTIAAADGTMHDATVAQSSGNDALDAAAIECSKHVISQRVRAQGQYIDVTWQMAFTWHHDGHTYFSPPLLAHDDDACKYPEMALRLDQQGDTIVTYDIDTSGAVGNIQVVKSSGTPELDDAAIACAAARRYPPPTPHGAQTSVQWYSRVVWRISD